MTWLAFCLIYASFALLALAMDRHHEDVFGRALAARLRWPLRAAGFAGLALSLYVSALVYGWSYGAVEWIGMLAIAGLLIIWIMAYRPMLAMALGMGCAMAAPVLAWN